MKLILETNGKLTGRIIEGIALVPTVSLNGNIYTAEEISAAQNVGVPLKADWEHTEENIGTVTYSLIEHNGAPALSYRAEITTDRAHELQEGIHKVSIEADVREAVQSCNRVRCYNLVSGLKMEGIGITKTPGVTQTTMSIIESYQEWEPIKSAKCHNCLEVSEEDKIKKLEAQVAELKAMLVPKCKTCGKNKVL